MSDSSNLYVCLLSGCSKDYYPNNTLSKFRIKLPYTLNLPTEEKWQVGLTRFACTSIKDIHYRDINVPKIYFNFIDAGDQNFSLLELIQVVPQFLESIDVLSFFNMYHSTRAVPKPKYNGNKFIDVKSSKTIIKIPTQFIFSPRDLFNWYFNEIAKEEWQNEIKYLKASIKIILEKKRVFK